MSDEVSKLERIEIPRSDKDLETLGLDAIRPALFISDPKKRDECRVAVAELIRRITERDLEIAKLKSQLEIAEAFHSVAVAERDEARVLLTAEKLRVEELKAEVENLKHNHGAGGDER